MYCPECGSKNTNDAVYCENCGLNLSKVNLSPSSSPSGPPQSSRYSDSSGPVYEAPIRDDMANQGRSSILDGLEDASIADYRDHVSPIYYFISFIFWPIGFFFWAHHRENKPDSARNLLVSTLSGFFLMILLFIL